MSYLRRNALSFLREAERDFNDGELNLAMFHLEQALQLALKYTLYERTGTFKRAHDVMDLLEDIIKLTNNDKLRELLEKEAHILDLLRQAYISARYLPIQYSGRSVQEALNLVRLILHELELL
ncbi:HEPN domain-containing protein [Caldivirga sp. UBA161]|uniref:HEPN domain-containing protein n=1 Tax=Caldivirga sp. UBA161 TaxID=1915569 RepID=UPI0025C6793E|nr:HEPN domain-containing protein [Caldivirga sp. UBA161]